MYGIHNFRASALGQIVQFTNQGPVHELDLVVRGRIEMMTKQALGTHGNGIHSGVGNETDVFDNLLCKYGLCEFIRSVLLLLDIYSYVVSRVYLVL